MTRGEIGQHGGLWHQLASGALSMQRGNEETLRRCVPGASRPARPCFPAYGKIRTHLCACQGVQGEWRKRGGRRQRLFKLLLYCPFDLGILRSAPANKSLPLEFFGSMADLGIKLTLILGTRVGTQLLVPVGRKARGQGKAAGQNLSMEKKKKKKSRLFSLSHFSSSAYNRLGVCVASYHACDGWVLVDSCGRD